MKRDFKTWFSTFRKSINGYKYYTSFETVYKNAESYKIELNILNSLIGSNDIQNDFYNLLIQYPEVIRAVPILLAKREQEIFCMDEKGTYIYAFDKENQTPEQYCYFMRETGLFDLISNHVIGSLYDYVLGVNVGLDSNGRKNRGGDQMEDLVEGYLKELEVEYYKEMYLTEVEKKWQLDFSSISAEGTTTKRWDFVVKGKRNIFVIETNFYSSGGSKLNETARSYKMIAEESRNLVGAEFVWITDGAGWQSAKNNLEETFNSMEHIYNINDLENGIFNSLLF